MKKNKFFCIICGGDDFSSGPGGRLSSTGYLPHCMKCGSLERHRALRGLYNSLFGPLRDKFANALQISNDLIIPNGIFNVHEISIYGGTNSIDIMNIDRPSKSYGWVSCNHVLEHVSDDRGAIANLFRILKDDGVLQLSVPNPLHLTNTVDWGYPDETRHGHYREYGKDDFLPKFTDEIKKYEMFVFKAIGIDNVTNTKELAYFFTRDEDLITKISDSLADCY